MKIIKFMKRLYTHVSNTDKLSKENIYCINTYGSIV